MQLGQNVYAYGKSFRKSCPSSLGTSQARTLLDETSWGTQYCPTAWIQQALDRMWGRTGGQGNKALGPAGEIKKRRHQCLPCNPGFCLIFQGSSWSSAMTSFSFFSLLFFATGGRQSNSLLVLRPELALLQDCGVEPCSYFLSQAEPSLLYTLLIRTEEVYWVHRTRMQNHSGFWQRLRFPAACFLGHMVLARSFWTWSCVVALAQDQLTIKKFPTCLEKGQNRLTSICKIPR